MQRKRLLLVRHGETEANISKVWHGSTDTALTEQGEHQRHLLAAYFSNYMLKPELIIASPLQRARLTAEAIAETHDLPLALNKDLQEYCLGDWENIGFDKLNNELGLFKSMAADEHYRTPGGESRNDVATRILNTMEEAWNQDAENIVLVAHAMALSLALSQIATGSSDNWREFLMDNTAVTEINFAKKEITKFNQTDHLGQQLSRVSTQLDTLNT